MRRILVAVAVVAAGCGSSHVGARHTAASLVPADASAYVSVDARRDFPARDVLLAQLPAAADEVDVAQLGSETVAFTRRRPSKVKPNYSVQQIGDWYVVAASQEAFARVRAAQNGTSLADATAFKRAWAKLDPDAVARMYGARDGLTGQAVADGDALRIRASTRSTANLREGASPLLRDIPTGAALAVSFHGGAGIVDRVPVVAPLAPFLRGDGILYVRPAGLVPEFAVELVSPNPQTTLADVRALLRRNANVLGPIPLTATISAGKVVVFDGPSALAALRSGPKLVDDASYKDAVRAAGVPSKSAVFAYADVTALAPFIQLAAQALGGKPLDPAVGKNLERLGTVVAWVTRTGSGLELHAWVRPQ